jgi:uncharacterized protein YyaL (SSP411 family)
MLYDNALLCEVYTDAYLSYNDENYLKIAKECADFWQNFMSEDLLFYSASDADSDGEEGRYFIYSYDEIYNALTQNGYEDIQTMMDQMEISHHGNFEGKNIIRINTQKIPAYFDDVKIILQNLRKDRKYPFIDKKIQTSWSAMMIKALFNLGQVDAKYTDLAEKSLESLLSKLYIDSKLYHTTMVDKKPKVEAFLEDYAFLSSALITAYKFTQNEIYLIDAQRFVNSALEKFYKNGVWNFSDGEFITKSEIYDNTYTSAISVMLDVMLSLGTLLGDEKYTHFSFKTLEYNSFELGRKPVHSPAMLIQMIRYLRGDRVIKASLTNLSDNFNTLGSLDYPFIHYKLSDEDGFMICGESSCFSKCDEVNEINNLVSNSF